MYQVRTVKTIDNKQIDKITVAVHQFITKYAHDHFNLDFGYENTEPMKAFINFILHESTFPSGKTENEGT